MFVRERVRTIAGISMYDRRKVLAGVDVWGYLQHEKGVLLLWRGHKISSAPSCGGLRLRLAVSSLFPSHVDQFSEAYLVQ